MLNCIFIMNFLKSLRKVTANSLKCRRSILTSSSPNAVRQFQTAGSLVNKDAIITNLCEKFSCNEFIAKRIYSKFPSLLPIDAVRTESLEFLRENVSAQSIVENPSLVTIDLGTLERKLNLLYTLKPKKIDDFVPLLTLDENDLNHLVKRMLKEGHEIEQGNRIYYLSETLKVEPKVISQYRANCGYELFSSTFRNFKKKLNVVLDYGVSRIDVLKSLYALRCNDSVFVRRSERMLSIGLPIKLWYYQLSEEDFDELIERHTGNQRKIVSSLNKSLAKKLRKRNLEKVTIVDTLKTLLRCDDSESAEIYYNHVNEIDELEAAKTNIQYLLTIPVSLETIKENGFLLTMPLSDIKEKLDILKEMQPKEIEDFLPLTIVDTDELTEYKMDLKNDDCIGTDHPIYYFSERLNIPANVVAVRFAEGKQIFFKQGRRLLKSKLDVLLKYDVDPSSILSCRTTFTHGVGRIEEIICKLKSNGIDKISSWMIFSFQRTDHDKLISDFMREKSSLEGFSSTMEYIAHRLGWDEYQLTIALTKFPKITKCSASRIKVHLDYLLNDTQFSAEDVTHCLYILNKNIDEIKVRCEEMKRIGAPITLPILYQAKSKYLRYIGHYCTDAKDFQSIENRLKSEKTTKKPER